MVAGYSDGLRNSPEDVSREGVRGDVRIDTYRLRAPVRGRRTSILERGGEVEFPSVCSLVPVMDVIVDGPQCSVISPLVNGLPLQEAADGDGHRLADLMLSAAETLGALHAAGTIHGALLPQMFTVVDGRVMVRGTGVTSALHRHGLHLSDETLRLVRAPELRVDTRPTPQSDLYSLGVVVYLALLGATPGEGCEWSVIEALLFWMRSLCAPSEIAPAVDRAWDAILIRLLHPDLARRYGTAADLIRDLHILRRG